MLFRQRYMVLGEGNSHSSLTASVTLRDSGRNYELVTALGVQRTLVPQLGGCHKMGFQGAGYSCPGMREDRRGAMSVVNPGSPWDRSSRDCGPIPVGVHTSRSSPNMYEWLCCSPNTSSTRARLFRPSAGKDFHMLRSGTGKEGLRG